MPRVSWICLLALPLALGACAAPGDAEPYDTEGWCSYPGLFVEYLGPCTLEGTRGYAHDSYRGQYLDEGYGKAGVGLAVSPSESFAFGVTYHGLIDKSRDVGLDIVAGVFGPQDAFGSECAPC